MASLMRVNCPECGAGLKSSAGFAVGQAVTCPKCETDFTVEDPDEAPARGRKSADDELPDDDDRPRKKKRRDDDDEPAGKSYKNSPLRFVVLGVLVIAMLVLGYMLYQKKQKEKDETAVPAPTGSVVPA